MKMTLNDALTYAKAGNWDKAWEVAQRDDGLDSNVTFDEWKPFAERCLARRDAESPQMPPLMRVYQEAKRATRDALLLFQMGDFYELFGEDAVTVAAVLGLRTTTRGDTPMAAFPCHCCDLYLCKLVALGYRVAVCKQMH
jgi:hypothetical protein